MAEQDALKEALLEFIAGPLLETAIPSEVSCHTLLLHARVKTSRMRSTFNG